MVQVFTIDNGNSNPNIAIFENSDIKEILLKDAFLARYKNPAAEAQAIMANVGFPNELPELFGDRLLRLSAYRTQNAFLDMPVDYTLTLGEDRLALGYHVYKTMPHKLPALVIDSGTFTTIDIIDANGFQGGYIFPGVRRFYEIYGSSARLPDLSQSEFTINETRDLPHSTEDAILNAGQIYWNGVFKEIARTADNIKTVVLTGGDAVKLEPLLAKLYNKREIITDSRLIHLGLYTVYTSIKGL